MWEFLLHLVAWVLGIYFGLLVLREFVADLPIAYATLRLAWVQQGDAPQLEKVKTLALGLRVLIGGRIFTALFDLIGGDSLQWLREECELVLKQLYRDIEDTQLRKQVELMVLSSAYVRAPYRHKDTFIEELKQFSAKQENIWSGFRGGE